VFTHILVPLDGSEYSERAVEPARSLAEKYGASITLLTVMLRFPESKLQVPKVDQRSEERGQRYLADVRAIKMGTAAVPVALVTKHGTPAESIVECATESQHDRDAVLPGKHCLENPPGCALSCTAPSRPSTSHARRRRPRALLSFT
jgi:nucleotide-binding universal stress UspA family protein